MPPASSASLLLRVSGTPGHDQAQFKWAKGPGASIPDPASQTTGLCIYDQTAPGNYDVAFHGSPSVPGGGTWTATRTGWKFKSKSGAPDGITKVAIQAGRRPQLQVGAKGSLILAPLPLHGDPSVIAQFKTGSGVCWEATFSTPKLNTPTAFKAKSD
jgi:hypothetical protein